MNKLKALLARYLALPPFVKHGISVLIGFVAGALVY